MKTKTFTAETQRRGDIRLVQPFPGLRASASLR
jgi:hypothetical protein